MTKPYTKRSGSGIRLSKTISNDGVISDPITAVYSWTNRADGVSLPNWRQIISNGDQATTVFSAFQLEVKSTPGYLARQGWISSNHVPVNFRSAEVIGDFDQSDFRSFTHTGSSDASAVAKADSQFYSRAHSAIVALEGGELLGEIGETVRSILNLTKRLSSGFSDWRRTLSKARRLKRTGRALTGIISDAYLEWKFGWDPLAKDIQALANDLKDDFVEIVPIKAHGEETVVLQADKFPYQDSSLVNCSGSIKRSEQTSVRYKAGIRVKRYGVGGLAETLGLSPRNFLPTVYNLLPWTYMFDYFSNLGNIVSAIAFDNARIAWVSRTLRRVATVQVTTGFDVVQKPPGIPNWEDAPGYPIAVPSQVTWTSKEVYRGAAVPEVPRLYLKFPNFGTTGGNIQGINTAAVLAAQTWGSKEMSRFRNG